MHRVSLGKCDVVYGRHGLNVVLSVYRLERNRSSSDINSKFILYTLQITL